METWANFSQGDVILAIVGMAGFISVAITMATASHRINVLEVERKTSDK